MFFATGSLKNLDAGRAAISGKRSELLDAYLTRTYEVPRAKEFAEHGLARRLKSMTTCIESVFEILPPEREDLPSIEELTHAVIYIQAFVFNAFGCLDNLAWIWVCEKQLRKDDGTPIPNTKIGLGKTCKAIRRSLPSTFQAHLKTLDEWFKHLEDFRHALAHRIPLYIPPYVVPEKSYSTYELLEQRKAKASRQGNDAKYVQLKAEQEALIRFEPVMTHSIADKSKRIVFHAQLLADFDTIYELAKMMDAALDSAPEGAITRVLRTRALVLKEVVLRGWSNIAAGFRRFTSSAGR